jgi:hypothetical protein
MSKLVFRLQISDFLLNKIIYLLTVFSVVDVKKHALNGIKTNCFNFFFSLKNANNDFNFQSNFAAGSSVYQLFLQIATKIQRCQTPTCYELFYCQLTYFECFTPGQKSKNSKWLSKYNVIPNMNKIFASENVEHEFNAFVRTFCYLYGNNKKCHYACTLQRRPTILSHFEKCKKLATTVYQKNN